MHKIKAIKASMDIQQTIIDALKHAGINATAQRIAVGRYVLLEADHPTADEVKAAVDEVFPKISMATIYNTLHTLEKAGILRAVKLPHTGRWCTTEIWNLIIT